MGSSSFKPSSSVAAGAGALGAGLELADLLPRVAAVLVLGEVFQVPFPLGDGFLVLPLLSQRFRQRAARAPVVLGHAFDQLVGPEVLLARDLELAIKWLPFNVETFEFDLEDLDAANLDDVAAFFQQFYAPNNAVVVVVGDFEGYLHWLDKSDGSMVARTRVGSDPITTGVQVVNGILYVQGDGGELAAVRLPAP